MTAKHADAWKDFWAQNASAGKDGGCLPAKWQGIDTAQRATWRKFGEKLPRNAHVLDIATGDGRVMSWMLKNRRDLKFLGVDMAPQLPPAPKGTKTKAGVAMESLPLPKEKFDGVVSQFGFEYGDLEKASAEIARVLKPNGIVGLITHRIDGPILSHNLARREQIGWALTEQDLITIAKRSLQLRASGLQTVSPKLASAPAEGARLFGEGSAAWEIPEAIRRTMIMGARDHPTNVAQMLDTIAERARNEMGRIASLEAACQQTADDLDFQAALAKGGLSQVSVTPLVEQMSSKPFADFRVITHDD